MGTRNFVIVLLLALPAVLSAHVVHKKPDTLLFPYGPAHNDNENPKVDDGASDKIKLPSPFKFFNNSYNDCYVNNNGAISFKEAVTAYTPDAFPIPNFCLIAPFWADVDNEKEEDGHIFWGLRTDKEYLEPMCDEVNNAFEALVCIAQWALMATWHEVAYHGSESDKMNTFQCVLLKSELGCFVIYNYDKIQWTTGTASGGDPKTGLGGTSAQAGFNTESAHFNMPHSRTDHIVNIKSTSNIGKPGRWIFQVDKLMAPGGCLHQESFIRYGQTMWIDEACHQKCICKRSSQKMECEEKKCDDGLVCLPFGKHYMCQIDEEDC